LRRFDFVSIGAQDAARADRAFLIRLAQQVEALGAHRLRIADSVGLMNPFQVEELFTDLSETCPDLPLAFHAHNDLGMATANSLAAFYGGAEAVDVTACGIGERAGNAPLEQMALVWPECGVKPVELTRLCTTVQRAAQLTIAPNQPLIGQNIFRHESGIHVHAMLQNSQAYEPFSAETIGRSDTTRIVLGYHSGESAIRHALQELGIDPRSEPLGWLLRRIKQYAQQTKQPITPAVLKNLYYE
jgi:homocitrate synthase NifV